MLLTKPLYTGADALKHWPRLPGDLLLTKPLYHELNLGIQVLMLSSTGKDFRATYAVEEGMIYNVTILSHGYGFLQSSAH